MALFHHRSLGQWKSISTRGALKLAAANIPFENSSTAFGALHPYGQSNILEIVNTTILVRKSTEKVFEQHRSVFFHKSSCILAIYKDIYIELTKISTAITTQNKNFTLLMHDLRKVLGPKKLLTAAAIAYAKYIDFRSCIKYMNFVNIMAYDVADPPKHHTTLFRSPLSGKITVLCGDCGTNKY
jgi:hypothetical protein